MSDKESPEAIAERLLNEELLVLIDCAEEGAVMRHCDGLTRNWHYEWEDAWDGAVAAIAAEIRRARGEPEDGVILR